MGIWTMVFTVSKGKQFPASWLNVKLKEVHVLKSKDIFINIPIQIFKSEKLIDVFTVTVSN